MGIYAAMSLDNGRVVTANIPSHFNVFEVADQDWIFRR